MSDGQSQGQGRAEDFSWNQLFLRDLAEVHLLIDFISGRPDKSLADLKGVPIFIDGKLIDGAPSTQVVEEISKIAFPPDHNAGVRAHQAALLHAAKDRLNHLADPAKGLTVAFTQMFAGIVLPDGERRRASLPNDRGGGKPYTPIDFFAARTAYPNLERQARNFSGFYKRLPSMAIILVIAIVYLNWDINVTSAVLQQISTADSDYHKLFQTDKSFIPTIEACHALAAPSAPTPSSATSAARRRSAKAVKTRTAPVTAASPNVAEIAVGHHLICDQADAIFAQRIASRANLLTLMTVPTVLLHPVAVTVRVFDLGKIPAPALVNDSVSNAAIRALNSGRLQKSPIEDLTIAVVTGLNNIIVPSLFGLLGTLVAVLRSLTTKMRENTLAPRDYQISRISIFLGMAAGLTVGLFFNPTDPSGTITRSMGGTISVSAASLAFLAGVGAEAFFTFLDGLIDRLFPKARSFPAKP